MYAQRNIEELSLKHCCNGKVTFITYYEIVFEFLGIQHANGMRHIVICCLTRCSVFFHFIS
jgi:hypothetical protein